MEKVLITGGSGFIGLATKTKLCNLDYKILSIGRAINEDIIIDLKDNKKLKKILDDFQPNIVLHFASGSNITRANENKDKEFGDTITATSNLINCLKEVNLNPKFIYLSSQAVYGIPESLPISELHPTKPITIYGTCKLRTEELIVNSKFDYLIFRIPSIFGKNQNFNKSGVIAKFIEKMQAGQSPIIFNDPDIISDFIYIEDVADVIVKGLTDKIYPSIKNKIFNLGSGKPTSLKQVLDILYLYFPGTPIPELKENNLYLSKAQKGLYLDINKIKKALEWEPLYTIETGLKDMIENTKSFKNAQAIY